MGNIKFIFFLMTRSFEANVGFIAMPGATIFAFFATFIIDEKTSFLYSSKNKIVFKKNLDYNFFRSTVNRKTYHGITMQVNI
jgi:hypothetical protein